MGADQNFDWHGAAASALDWWRDAGVDVVVEDAAFNWLAPPPAPQALVPAADPAAALPATLEAFAAWRTGADMPDAAWGGATILAAGAAGAELMVVVDCPEPGDREALMEGEVGRLFDRMLAAIGRTRADVLLASVCTRRPTTGRVPRELLARLGEIARHHVGLAGPKRILALGDAASRALLGMGAHESRGRLHALNLNGGIKVDVVASHHPRFLLDRPAAKGEAWRDLLMLTEGLGQDMRA
jgi:uracil-DNA glycosylase family 4